MAEQAVWLKVELVEQDLLLLSLHQALYYMLHKVVAVELELVVVLV
jgi:hypothetical protein